MIFSVQVTFLWLAIVEVQLITGKLLREVHVHVYKTVIPCVLTQADVLRFYVVWSKMDVVSLLTTQSRLQGVGHVPVCWILRTNNHSRCVNRFIRGLEST